MKTMKVAFGIAVVLMLSVAMVTVYDTDTTDAAEPPIIDIKYNSDLGGFVLEMDDSVNGKRVTLTVSGNDSLSGSAEVQKGIAIIEPSNSSGLSVSKGKWNVEASMQFMGSYVTSMTICSLTLQSGTESHEILLSEGPYTLGSYESYGFTAPEGKMFGGWTFDGEALDAGTSIDIAADGNNYSLTAEAIWNDATPDKYTVTFDQPANGSLTVTYDGTEIQSGKQVPYGTEIVITAAPDQGYELETLTVNGESFQNGGTHTVNDNVIVVASFKESGSEPDTYTVTVHSASGGTVTGGGDYKVGETVILTATSGTGYAFVKWQIDGVVVSDTSSETLTFVMPANDVTVTPVFDKIVYKVTVNANGEEIGTGTTTYGGSVKIGFEAPEGMKIDASNLPENIIVDGKTSGTITVQNVTSNVTVTVSFVELQKYNVTVDIAGNGTVSLDGTPISDGDVVIAIEDVPLVLNYESGADNYTVRCTVSDKNARVSNANGTLTVTGISEDCDVTIEFVKGYMVTVADSEHGDVFPGTGLQPENTTVTYTVMPDSGYAVSRVLVDGQEVEVIGNEFQVEIGESAHTISVEYVYVGIVDDDDDEEYIPPVVVVRPDDGGDSTTYIVAIAAAAVVAILAALILMQTRKS